MITLLMEAWTALVNWLLGRVDPDNPYGVWDILWRDGGEWYARPAGQHRQGFSVEAVLAEVARRDREAARLRASERYRLVAAA